MTRRRRAALALAVLGLPFLFFGLLAVPVIWRLDEVLGNWPLRFAFPVSAAAGLAALWCAWLIWRGSGEAPGPSRAPDPR